MGRRLAGVVIQWSSAATVVALTGGEAWLLRTAVVLFGLMLAFCGVVWHQVSQSSKVANDANAKATALDVRTAALEEKFGSKE